MRLLKLHHPSAHEAYINPLKILSIRSSEVAGVTMSIIYLEGGDMGFDTRSPEELVKLLENDK